MSKIKNNPIGFVGEIPSEIKALAFKWLLRIGMYVLAFFSTAIALTTFVIIHFKY